MINYNNISMTHEEEHLPLFKWSLQMNEVTFKLTQNLESIL